MVSAPPPEDIEAFIQIFEASDWDQVDIVLGDVELYLSKTSASVSRRVAGAAAASGVLPASLPQPVAVERALLVPDPAPDHAGWIEVVAPHLATFYRAPKAGAAPYVEVGDEVAADTELCLLEVMKLFTALQAGVKGTVRRICVADGGLVEGGQVLFLVEPPP